MSSHTYNAVTDLLDRNISEGRGDKLAFIDRNRRVTYRELQAESCRLAHLLRKLQIRQEQRVAMIMLDTVEYPAIFLGAIRAGIVPVLLNTLLPAEQYAYVLKDCRARALFVSPQLLSVVEPILPRLADLEHVVIVGEAPSGASFKTLKDSLDGFAGHIRNRGDASRRAGLLALLFGLDRHAERRETRPHEPDGDGRTLRARRARHA